jgi:hypothetical protein
MRRFLNKPTSKSDKVNVICYRSIYQGIRKFCAVSSCLAKSQQRYAARSSNSRVPYASIRRLASKSFLMTAAEQEWLQGEEEHSWFPQPTKAKPTSRFDWRLRASSQVPSTHTLVGDHKKAGSGDIRRVQPPSRDLQVGEPFFEQIQSYEARWAIPM